MLHKIAKFCFEALYQGVLLYVGYYVGVFLISKLFG